MEIDITTEKRIRKLKKKAKEIIVRNCKWRSRDGHSFSCDYEGTSVVKCNVIGREKCPLTGLLDE
jgi:hypothetical protein